MLPHINVLTETCIKANVLMREIDTLCKMDGALQEGEARGNNKLKGAKQRLEPLLGSRFPVSPQTKGFLNAGEFICRETGFHFIGI